jgi:G3E family GTPase
MTEGALGARPIAVSLLTGFLGSGKTTLIRELLRHPAMGRLAVIINEFGSIGLDHELIEASDENFVQLSNGCLCCNVRSDLVFTLCDLAVRRRRAKVPAFERVMIETTGLADPVPILQALMTDRELIESYLLDNVITTVDALTGCDSIERFQEASRQIAAADRIVLTKSDVASGDACDVQERLTMLNPHAPVLRVVRGVVSPSVLFDVGLHGISRSRNGAQAWLTHEESSTSGSARHSASVSQLQTACVVRDQPLSAVTVSLFLAALAENCGSGLLRMKGIVCVAERPDRPAIVHGVQNVFHEPIWLERWPSNDHRTRLVFIGTRIHERWVRNLLVLLNAEVADEATRFRTGGGDSRRPVLLN